MVNISSQNPTSRYAVRNKWIDGFTFTPVLTGSGNLGGTWLDLTQMTMKGTLTRNGVSNTLFNTTLLNLLIISLIMNPLWFYMFPTVTGGLHLIAGPTKALVPLRFDLGGPLNLTDNDEFAVEWNLNPTSFFTATNVTVASCYIQMDECETAEIEWVTPFLDVTVIEGTQQQISYSLGDNVLSVLLVNYDKTANYTYDANQVVNMLVLTGQCAGKQYGKNDNFYEILTKNYSYYPTYQEAGYRYQNWIVYSGGDELDAVKLDLTLNIANVTSSKNFVLVRRFFTDNWLVSRATLLRDIKDSSKDDKGKYDDSLVVSSSRSRN